MNAIPLRILLGALAALALGAAACAGTSSPERDTTTGGTDDGDGSSDDDGGDASGVGGGHGSGGAGAGAGVGSGGGPGCASGTPFDLAALEASVTFLASDELAGRAPGTPGDEAARAHIEERFACIGLTAAGDAGSFQQAFVTSTGKTTKNVVGYLPGSDPAVASEIILVGAHHDHLGEMGGEIYSGANDNASGVAAMMAIAHAVKQRAMPPRRTVAFVAFGYEEHDGDCEGSQFYVGSAPDALGIDHVVYMVNTDMVGVYPLEESLTAYGSFSGTPGRALLDDLLELHPSLSVELDVAADEDASDFQAFYDLGIPYLYFETWDEPCWHQPCDRADRIDYPSLAEIASLAFEVVVGLADGGADLAAAREAPACAPARASQPGRHSHLGHDHGGR